MKISKIKTGFLSFFLVLLLMPIGHALMVLTETIFEGQALMAAFVIGMIGLFLVFLGIRVDANQKAATLLGLLGGVILWTGWVEFSFVWIAHKLNVSPLIEDGEVATKPEYLVMLSSLGLLSAVLMFFVSSKTRCQFLIWLQKVFGIHVGAKALDRGGKFISVTTFIETTMLLWTFYIVLLLVYDEEIAGQNHPLTYVVAFGSLAWSGYLFLRLLRIQQFDYAIRYAVPTVIIFWNFVEVMGRWNLLDEIWVQPVEHWPEVSAIMLCLIGCVAFYVWEMRREESGSKPSHETSPGA